ncbi:MAG: hypothetical protein CHACPFDD_00021 [Phycisphaerae bacterium]|nr:hypothetical protein [Phycisphaerae bacterium]
MSRIDERRGSEVGRAARARRGRCRQHWTKRAGFTLFELIVVVVVVAIISALALPQFGGASDRQRTAGAAQRVAADIALAARHARVTGTTVSVVFSGGGSYKIPGLPHLDRSAAEYAVSLSAEPHVVTFKTVDFGGDTTLKFDGYGSPDSGGLLVLAAGNSVHSVTVDASSGVATVVEGLVALEK